jgi:tetratricopeptide (TPR) repeat protein
MSDDNPLPKPFTVTIGVITSTIAFITAIVGFILLWKGNTEIVSTVVIAVGVIGLWASLFYIRFAIKAVKKQEPTLEHRKRTKKPGFAFSQKIRYLALIGIYTLPIIALSGIGIYYYKANQPNDELVVLIANFDGPDPHKYGVSQFLNERINEGLNGIRNIRVEMLNETVSGTQGPEAALEITRQKKASLIVWGWYVATGQGINVTYHLTSPNADMGFGINDSRDEQINLAAPIERVNTFEFQSTELADNIVIDTLRVVYEIYANQEEPQNTLLLVDKTLKYLETHEDSFSDYKSYYSAVLSTRVGPDFYIYGPEKALEDANAAIAYYPSSSAYFNRATLHYFLGQNQAALDDVYQSLNYPNLESYTAYLPYNRIAQIYYEQGKYNEALDILTQGLNKITNCSAQYGCHFLRYRRGMVYLKLNDVSHAKEDFEVVKSIVNDPAISTYLDSLINP